ncbi:MAG: glycosyltransferase [Rhodospirillaceae bacterium]|nr:glycosyltransferase [Rhodospirillaceae bacterium]
MTLEFSILTRTALRLPFLERARVGLEAAAPGSAEWIICDDAPEGTPGMAAFVEAARHALPFEVRLVETRSASRPRAANGALAAARGRLVHLHDDDDTVEPAFYRRTAAFLDARPDCGGVAVLCDRVDEELARDGTFRTLRRRPHYHEIRSVGLLSMATTQTVPPIGFVARRSVLDAVGPFDESLSVCEDHEYFLRFLLQADIGLVRERLAAFHHRPSPEQPGACNSLASTDHEAQDARFRTLMLRRDMAQGGMGLGWLLALGEMNRPAWRRKVFLRRLGRRLPTAIARRL